MKILTLNTHSLQEENYEKKLNWFIDALLTIRPDLVALQEVNQTEAAPPVKADCTAGQIPVPGCRIPVRTDNHAAETARRLRCAGICCSWVWLPIKRGYGKYDEGAAMLSLNKKIADIDVLQLSHCDDYSNWRTRKALGIRLEGESDWFYTIHMGWWKDEEEPFFDQWNRLEKGLSEKKEKSRIWLMGDFNSPAEVRGEGYDLIRSSGWKDTFLMAEKKDDGITVSGIIDGWRDKMDGNASGMRIDHIWCSREVPVTRSDVIFNGNVEEIVSDHFGILLEI